MIRVRGKAQQPPSHQWKKNLHRVVKGGITGGHVRAPGWGGACFQIPRSWLGGRVWTLPISFVIDALFFSGSSGGRINDCLSYNWIQLDAPFWSHNQYHGFLKHAEELGVAVANYINELFFQPLPLGIRVPLRRPLQVCAEWTEEVHDGRTL
ncbi:hypothetical protein GQ43DRAFT_430402 [Delitschia confertaspora ATCC 74209]|uniref:Uncharacterized protein n=1 Tax=Delitschia confertaspora ATCC 74209 TaxID=1513339 RepID=A0A9P4MU92_9PLEO|nr:hypothetical protein GQ43DRAFT_430402 [Delitschia confertaspora ATCC 74209]